MDEEGGHMFLGIGSLRGHEDQDGTQESGFGERATPPPLLHPPLAVPAGEKAGRGRERTAEKAAAGRINYHCI